MEFKAFHFLLRIQIQPSLVATQLLSDCPVVLIIPVHFPVEKSPHNKNNTTTHGAY